MLRKPREDVPLMHARLISEAVMIINDFVDFFKDHFRIFANKHCEILRCQQCGREYPSRGLRDIGICPECLREQTFIGGALDDRNTSETENR